MPHPASIPWLTVNSMLRLSALLVGKHRSFLLCCFLLCLSQQSPAFGNIKGLLSDYCLTMDLQINSCFDPGSPAMAASPGQYLPSFRNNKDPSFNGWKLTGQQGTIRSQWEQEHSVWYFQKHYPCYKAFGICPLFAPPLNISLP